MARKIKNALAGRCHQGASTAYNYSAWGAGSHPSYHPDLGILANLKENFIFGGKPALSLRL